MCIMQRASAPKWPRQPARHTVHRRIDERYNPAFAPVLDLCNISLVAFIMGERDTYNVCVCNTFCWKSLYASLACGATANTDQHPAEWVNCRYSKCNAPVCVCCGWCDIMKSTARGFTRDSKQAERPAWNFAGISAFVMNSRPPAQQKNALFCVSVLLDNFIKCILLESIKNINVFNVK